MKKITKTFYVDAGVNPDDKNLAGFWVNTKSEEGLDNPIEITFSVPEKKITLSESDYDNLTSHLGYFRAPGEERPIPSHHHQREIITTIKQKLFGDTHD